MTNPKALYPIRAISEMTGVHPVTLRAWERRYGLIRPHRTAKGHRLYSEDDIQLVHKVVALLEKGISVSQVQSHIANHESKSEQPQATKSSDYWSTTLQAMLNAIIRFDPNRLDATYNEAIALYPIDVVTQHLLTPLLKVLGERWTTVDAGIAEEHFFGTYMRNKLGARLHHLNGRKKDGPTLVAACLPGEFHELGLLLFAISAMEQGWNAVVLGANMPIEQLVLVAKRSEAVAVVLSGSADPTDKTLFSSLSDLVSQCGLPVFVGGTAALSALDQIRRTGAHPLGLPIPAALAYIRDVIDELTLGNEL